MRFHVVGRWQVGAERNSLAVVQFVDLLRGERAVKAPANRFQVETVGAEELYCLWCLDVRWADVARGARQQVLWKRCRCCGREAQG